MNIEKERKAFEAWLFKYYPKAEELGIVYRPNENLYEHRQTQIRWIAWQAAKAQAELQIEQAKQSKIDELPKQRDSFIKAYEIELNESVALQKRVDAALKMISISRGFSWGHVSIGQLEQVLKGNN